MAASMTEQAALRRLRPAPGPATATPSAMPLTTREIFRDHAAFVLRLVRRLGVLPGDAEDVAQEVFVTVHRQLGTLQDPQRLRSWLFGIVRRVVANHRRLAYRRHERLIAQFEAVTGPEPAPANELSLDRALLEHALSKLDARKREVFVLFELEELAMRDVAEIVGCPLYTAYSRLYAARKIVTRAVLHARPLPGRRT